MGVGYQASALHKIAYLVVDEAAPSTSEPPSWWKLPPIPGAQYATEPARVRSPTAVDVIAWRDQLAIKYRGQLGEVLTWDEASDFVESEDAATSADVLLRYVAARIDERGTQGIRSLIDAEGPPSVEIGRALEGAESRGFTSRFPQLLLRSAFWLPFHRNMIIEEPDWQGRTERFGSNFRLEEELRDLRMLIAEADPRSGEWTSDRSVPTKVLWAAWQASEMMGRICAAATSRHLPFWTTG
ncbi:hypothetical protein FRZ44_48230 [Hypericibacter terrae]|uniref:Uncharacterized protein n=1 Tax=Hypericibacter terrae TaxID=2602015 RepID=A0A5J6MQ87_9PROT|nr:hypothetical protein [Hypericibacter terrae]QEX19509.1 hypothetical protein FRZ44_48230 [Hypericibacter terrae]